MSSEDSFVEGHLYYCCWRQSDAQPIIETWRYMGRVKRDAMSDDVEDPNRFLLFRKVGGERDPVVDILVPSLTQARQHYVSREQLIEMINEA